MENCLRERLIGEDEMTRTPLSRRRFGAIGIATVATALAGCSNDGSEGNGDDQTDENASGNGASEDENGSDGNESEVADENASENGELENDTDSSGDGNETSEDNASNESAEDLNETIEESQDPILTITLENEDGDPISSGVVITIEAEDEPVSIRLSESIEEGTVEQELAPGDYTVVVESEDNEFEPIEESVTMEDDEELTLTLEGATPEEAEEGEADEEVDESNESEGNESDDGNESEGNESNGDDQ